MQTVTGKHIIYLYLYGDVSSLAVVAVAMKTSCKQH